MSDPLKLAEMLSDPRDAFEAFTCTGPERRLLAAALRLAEAMLAWDDDHRNRVPFNALAAYRAAKEES